MTTSTLDQMIGELVRTAIDDVVAVARAQWEDEFLTIDEVCEWLKMSKVSLHDLRNNPRKGWPRPVGFTTSPRWRRSELLEWSERPENRMGR
ncbi:MULTISPECIES: helix-turn-helix transcriptional regulator [Sphingomonas]|uniref:helix-turn-helix transcriptional regulator n=1 Tax=Sphingomonas TaxID=13687 RepID=UPI001269E894|nr:MULTISPECIES: helix-turn-helix domain-containing protein [Sphingomonas]